MFSEELNRYVYNIMKLSECVWEQEEVSASSGEGEKEKGRGS